MGVVAEVKIEVNWGDDNYAHAEADVTGALNTWALDNGFDVTPNSQSIGVKPSSGEMVLFGDKYSNVENSAIGAAVLERHLCRIFIHGTEIWEGFAQHTKTNETGGHSYSQFILTAKNREQLGSTPRLREYGNQTVSETVQALATDVGVPLQTISIQEMGTVFHFGIVSEFMAELGNFAGGFWVETRDGGYTLIPYAYFGNLPIESALDESYGPMVGSAYEELTGLVRNTAFCSARIWVRDFDTSSVIRERVVVLSPEQEVVLEFSQLGADGSRVEFWDNAQADPDNPGTSIANIVNSGAEGGVFKVTVQGDRGTYSNEPARIVVTGRLQNLREAASFTVESTDYMTQQRYGAVVHETPPWYPTSGHGVFDDELRYLRSVSRPPTLVEMFYPLVQDSSGHLDVMLGLIDNGRRISNVINGNEFDGVVIGWTIQQSNGGVPILESRVLVTGPIVAPLIVPGQDQPANPSVIQMGIDLNEHVRTQLYVDVDDAVGEDLYFRWRKKNAASWTSVPARTVAQGQSRVEYVLTGLTFATQYEAEASFNSSYTDSAFASWTTKIAGADTDLRTLAVSGNTVPGNYETTSSFTYSYRLSDDENSITISANAQDSTAAVSISIGGIATQTVTVEGGNSYVFNIDVVNRGSVKHYTLTVNTVAATVQSSVDLGTLLTSPVGLTTYSSSTGRRIVPIALAVIEGNDNGRTSKAWSLSGDRASRYDVSVPASVGGNSWSSFLDSPPETASQGVSNELSVWAGKITSGSLRGAQAFRRGSNWVGLRRWQIVSLGSDAQAFFADAGYSYFLYIRSGQGSTARWTTVLSILESRWESTALDSVTPLPASLRTFDCRGAAILNTPVANAVYLLLWTGSELHLNRYSSSDSGFWHKTPRATSNLGNKDYKGLVIIPASTKAWTLEPAAKRLVQVDLP